MIILITFFNIDRRQMGVTLDLLQANSRKTLVGATGFEPVTSSL